MTWHLLLDYDTPQAVPGACEGSAKAMPGAPGAYDVDMVAVPAPSYCREELERRLSRAGYKVAAFSFELSTNGWHVKVELSPAPRWPLEIVALQAVCGSDPLREACNVQRAREVQSTPGYIAGMLHAALSAAVPAGCRPSGYSALLSQLAELDDLDPMRFFRDRWNTLYKPNPNRRRKDR